MYCSGGHPDREGSRDSSCVTVADIPGKIDKIIIIMLSIRNTFQQMLSPECSLYIRNTCFLPTPKLPFQGKSSKILKTCGTVLGQVCIFERNLFTYDVLYVHTPLYVLYLDEVFGIGGEHRVEDEVVKMSMFRGMVIVVIDEVLDIVMRANIAHLLQNNEHRKGLINFPFSTHKAVV